MALAITIAVVATAMVRAVSTVEELADHQHETRGIKMMLMRGEDDPCKTGKNSECRGQAGATMMPAFETLSRILSSAKTFP